MSGSTTVRIFLSLVLVFSLVTSEVNAQTSSRSPEAQWAQLRLLRSGIQVEVRAARKVKGTLVEVTDDAIIVYARGANQTLMRPEVREVKIPRTSGSMNNAILFAGIGGGGGAATGIILDGALTDGNGASSQAVVLFGLLGGLTGFVLGFLKPGSETVYKVKR